MRTIRPFSFLNGQAKIEVDIDNIQLDGEGELLSFLIQGLYVENNSPHPLELEISSSQAKRIFTIPAGTTRKKMRKFVTLENTDFSYNVTPTK